ncbi:NfeD family protein [Haloprofundus salinisoli]|uniref:NfeD family protein n=1 Tax=Haloprofundus salinisoli TaxID=2876193 RepID=UPI001CCD8E1E|nr:NfeD family protein [Haloprofundus salinisoli]
MARPRLAHVLLQLDIGPDALPLLLVMAGLGLSIAEALAPGANFIIVGIALLAAGLVGLFLPALASPLLLGVLVLLFGALSFYVYREFDFYGGKGTAQTSDSDALKGKTGRVTERVTPSAGQIKIAGGGFNPYYAARSYHGEIPEGAEVMVVDPGGGNVVMVESFEAVEDEIDRELAKGRRERERAADEVIEREREHEEETERA